MIPFRPPEKFVAGDSVKFSICDSEHRPSSGWSCKYQLANACGNHLFEAEVDPDHDHFNFFIPKTETENILPGDWQFQVFVDNELERYTLQTGRLRIQQGLSLTDGRVDTRTHAQRTLEAIECVLENRASRDQESVTLNGRSLSRTPIGDLLSLRDVYRAEVRREEVAERLESGMGSGQKVRIRFRNA